MKIKKPMWFFEDEPVAGSSPLDNLDVPELGEDGKIVVEGAPEPEPAAAGDVTKVDPEPEPEPKPPTIDYAALAAANAEAFKAAGLVPPPVAKVEEKPLTPEEAKKALNVWEPTKEWLERYDNLETRAAAIAEQRDGMIKQSDTIVQLRMQQMQEQFNSIIQPIAQYVSAQEASTREAAFDAKYPDLAKTEMKPLRDIVIGQLVQTKAFENKTQDQIFDLIAKGTETFAKAVNPAFKLTPAGSTPTGKAKTNPNALKPATAGSGGGGGKGTATPVKSGNKVLELLA